MGQETMAKHVNIDHEVDPDLSDEDFEIERTGANSYKVRTGDPNKHEFSKYKNKREAFDEKFVEKFNQVAEHSDRFELGHQDSRDSLRKVRRNITEGNSSFGLKVRE